MFALAMVMAIGLDFAADPLGFDVTLELEEEGEEEDEDDLDSFRVPMPNLLFRSEYHSFKNLIKKSTLIVSPLSSAFADFLENSFFSAAPNLF